ncbi:hypothetical protein [Paraprevotella xylaniphila]|uniref:hypothetical protein n=1 Tax=Paraprevotella xylaniphila TaxID=454155 RepID=UPI003AB8CD1B
MMNKYDRVIGIDPDVEKSGVTEIHVPTRKFNMTSLTFPQLMDYLQYIKKEFSDKAKENIVIVVEAGWLNASNWHTSKVKSIAAAAKTGQNTGRNHEVARKIAEMARHYGLEAQEVKPLKKCWKGNGGKITHEELSYIVGGLVGRTSQDARDSCLLAWVYAGLPIRVYAGL